MLKNWGAAAAITVAGMSLFAAQPTFPSPPTDAPTISFPAPLPGPVPGSGAPVPSIDPSPPTASRPGRPAVEHPPLPRSVNIQLKVERDGRLTVTEQVIVQAKDTMTREVPLRIGDRVFSVRDAKVDGSGTADVVGEKFVIRLNEGVSTVQYTVDGAVADLGDHQQVRWQVANGWSTTIVFLRASLLTPEPGDDPVCLAGASGSEDQCDSALIDVSGILRIIQSDLDAGHRIDLSLNLPAGLVPTTARFEEAKAGPFALTPVSGVALGGLALLLLGGFGALWLARGREATAVSAPVEPVDVLATEDGRVVFASPDGVLPGQAGTVVDEVVDGRDLAATVLDLAVRNYLWITEVAADDWQLVRRNPADDALTAYERAVYAAVLPDGTDSVTVSALRAAAPDVSAARAAAYADAVDRGWLSRAPGGLGRWGLIGLLLTVLGLATTVVLALTAGHALAGVALAIAGVAVFLGARFLPVRTQRGAALVQQVRGLSGYLRAVAPDSIPVADRELVFSRSLPYAVALGESDAWLTRFAALDVAADGTPGLYWYGTQDETYDQPRFAERFHALVDALTGIFTKH
ncbi:DUF2207 domain-containing protein [Alloactinosynnema sp. L-07]|uniref:DUF2207 domain-containing protein n=1 Tax=Alloactinosynnema sp. L-07 TaxID=1653480 RepID=UPI0012F7DB2F|nr:DUF2207 domain-containing protein [Alloactinosynnema sp. L-07]